MSCLVQSTKAKSSCRRGDLCRDLYKYAFPKGAVLFACFTSNWPVTGHSSLCGLSDFDVVEELVFNVEQCHLKNIEHVSKGSHVLH